LAIVFLESMVHIAAFTTKPSTDKSIYCPYSVIALMRLFFIQIRFFVEI